MQQAEPRIQLARSGNRLRSMHQGHGYRILKRIADIVFASLFLIALGLVMLLIAVAIKLYSPGPIFYCQRRIGKDGRPFTMLKFRSMHVGSDSEIHRKHVQRLIRENVDPDRLAGKSLKLRRDPRITSTLR